MTEIKVVGEKHCRQRKGQASAWQGLGMEDQCGRNRGSGASGELRHDVWGEHTGRGSGAALAVLSVPHKQEGAVADSVCWQNHYLAGTDDGWVCTAKPVRDYYRH